MSWQARGARCAGTVFLPQGLGRLRTGGVLPLTETRLAGTAGSPSGPIDLILDLEGAAVAVEFPAASSPTRAAGSCGSNRRLQDEPAPETPSSLPKVRIDR